MKKVLLPLAALLMSSGLSAETSNKDSDALIVTATRFATSIETAPVNVSVISSGEIENSGAINLAQAIESLAGVHVSDLYGISGSKSRVDLGGFGATGGQNTLVLLNGRRLNDVDLSGANLAAIPLESIERVEIIHGSSTVLYGDNATSGVINIVTRSGLDAKGSTVSVQAGSFNSTRISVSTTQGKEDIAFFLATDSAQSNGYRDNSAFDNTNLITELSRQNDTGVYGARLNASQETLELPGYLSEAVYENAPTTGSGTLEIAEEKRQSLEGFFSGEHLSGELALRKKHQEATVFGDTVADLSTVSFTPRTSRDFGKHTLVAGADLYVSTLDTKANFGFANNTSDTRRNSYALYFTDTYKINSMTSLDLGLREQQVNVDIENTDVLASTKTSDSKDDSLTAWDISLNHRHDDSGRSYLRLAGSFRFPVLDEMWSYTSGTISPLEAQRGRHIELGSSIPLGAESKLDAQLFYITLTDEIAFDSVSYANVNLDPTRHKGLNLNLHTQLTQSWSLQTAYSYRDAVFRSGSLKDKHIPEIPRHKLSLANQFKWGDSNNISLEAIYTGERYFGDDFANDGKKMPAYTWVNLGYGKTIDSWKIKLTVNNLTDVKTADAGYYGSWALPGNPYFYYPLPDRSLYLTVNKDF